MKQVLMVATVVTVLMTPGVYASDVASGKKLVDGQCQQCHDDAIYVRKDSIIQSLPELKARVEFCESANNKHWSEPQINQVVRYLNNTFYKYPTK